MRYVRVQWREFLRLCRVAGDRPPWQLLLAFVVSVWTLWWIGGQFLFSETAPSAIEVFGNLAGRFGIADSSWGERVARAWGHAGPFLAMLGGLLWAATNESGQVTALLGWVAVMLGSEQLGYQPAVLVSLASMVGLIALLWSCSLTSGRFVDRYPKLLPHDVLRAGVTAAALSAVVPLFAPAFFVFRLLRPYLTRAPKQLPPEGDGNRASGSRGWTEVPERPGSTSGT